MRIILPYLMILALVTGMSVSGSCQQKPAPKLTPPQLQSFIGNTKGGTLPLEMTLNLVDSAVWVIDAKKNRYYISRFVVLFRSKDRFEDEQTGEIKTHYNSSSLEVKNANYISESWRRYLYENFKSGDELLIGDIIARDRNGEYYKAPDIKILIQ